MSVNFHVICRLYFISIEFQVVSTTMIIIIVLILDNNTVFFSSQKLSIWYILENVLLCSAEERLIISDDLLLSCSFPAGVIKLDRLTVLTVIENSALLVCYQIYAIPVCRCIFYDHSVLKN